MNICDFILNIISSISTLAMAIIAFYALYTWKDEQKRSKLIIALESLNKFIQEVQYYEYESTIYSKKLRYNDEYNNLNIEQIQKQAYLIDIELTDVFGDCILNLKNWLINHEDQKDILNSICNYMQKYRELIVDYNKYKIKLYLEMFHPETIIYEHESTKLANDIKNQKDKIINVKKELLEAITKFKEQNKKLLK